MEQAAGLIVLVVDDYADTRELIRTLLEMNGCRVVEAANGREAIELAAQFELSFILMDLEMPVLNGYDATRELLSCPETTGVPVIALSANCSGDRRERAFAAGCIECHQKPLEVTLINELLSRYGSQ